MRSRALACRGVRTRAGGHMATSAALFEAPVSTGSCRSTGAKSAAAALLLALPGHLRVSSSACVDRELGRELEVVASSGVSPQTLLGGVRVHELKVSDWFASEAPASTEAGVK